MRTPERLAFKVARRLRQQKDECDRLLPFVKSVDTIIQVGLGNWWEGPHLLKRFPKATYYAIEPIARYCDEAKANGFPGTIYTGVAWDKSGQTLSFSMRRMRSSVFFTYKNKGTPIQSPSYALDDLFKDKPLGRTFLWMDCEGSELAALRGAEAYVLPSTEYVLSEIQGNPPIGGYTTENDVVSKLRSKGFKEVARRKNTAMFVKQ
jgi:FkbM family methyltransferase